ncbi:MAG: DEAD/DEAH box helicase family protein [Oscillibacter sp.]|jgi:type III restriction enzyme|nr:DEAD/DEAH box helicase family protein [Oscillibacter sp.]
MKFKFTIQPYQTEAVDSVTGVFAGQPFNDHFTYRRDAAPRRTAESWQQTEEEQYLGFANARVELSAGRLLENIRMTQARNNIKLSETLEHGLGACSLDIEMETGTGKTYVYIKTMFELNKRYGWSKFIVVVPSVAIREGVRKSFGAMQEHFMEHYGKKARFFVYDSKNLAEIDHFSQSAEIHVMIINTQAFNARGRDARRIRTEMDDFSSRRPIDVLKAARPIVILDEPQKMGGAATQESLREFQPLFCLNYSATHKQRHNLVYVLDALDAYHKRLVKHIEVKGFTLKNLRGTDGYLFLEDIVISPKKPPRARLEFEIGYSRSINRESRMVGVGDDLYALSKHMEQYRGFRVSDVDPVRGTLSFTNGTVVRTGEVTGDVSEADLRRVQIRETIRSHFEKEQELFGRGIKTLSLFFIDEVAKYRRYDADGEEVNAEYGEIFEREYADILDEYLSLGSTPYAQYLQSIEAHRTHAGYFSIDKKGRKVDSSLKRGSDESDDISAYDLILKDKERLLSFQNPVRFIFSHSALREGWDNPNVFQICTLKHGGNSPTQKRQEVGRGLRLCVDQRGVRMDADTLGIQVQQVNRLTVIASDGYQEFVADLQRGIREDLYERPVKAVPEYFIGKTLVVNGSEWTVSEKQGRDIYRYLIRNYYIDDDDRVSETYRAALAEGALAPLPESCSEIAAGVHALVQNIFDERVLDDMIQNGLESKVRENPLNDRFYSEEFQALWNCIRHKYAYTVDFDSEALIQKAIAHLDSTMFTAKLHYTVTTGRQGPAWTSEQLKSGGGFVMEHSQTHTLERTGSRFVKYDLVGKVAEGTRLTRRSAARILSGIEPRTFDMFKHNPEEFIAKAVRLINEQKAMLLVENIAYHPAEGAYDSTVFTAKKNTDLSQAYRAKRNVQDYVITDGYAKDGRSIERRFAEDLDAANEVLVYAKLPKAFSIPTPMGGYSPDWAIVFRRGMTRHAFVLAETKGSTDAWNLRPVEQAKIACVKKLFAALSPADVAYYAVDSYQHLLDVMEAL